MLKLNKTVICWKNKNKVLSNETIVIQIPIINKTEEKQMNRNESFSWLIFILTLAPQLAISFPPHWPIVRHLRSWRTVAMTTVTPWPISCYRCCCCCRHCERNRVEQDAEYIRLQDIQSPDQVSCNSKSNYILFYLCFDAEAVDIWIS